MKSDNPAARLLNIIKTGKSISGDEAARTAWAHILKIDQKDDQNLIHGIMKVMQLQSQILDEIGTRAPDKLEHQRFWVLPIYNAFLNCKLDEKWNLFIGKINAQAIAFLDMAEGLLAESSKPKEISDEKLHIIFESVQNLQREVLESDELNVDVKRTVSSYLQKILTAIKDYKILGITPLANSLEAALGHWALDEQYKQFTQDTKIGKKFSQVITDLASTITIAQGLPELAGSIFKMITN